MKTYATRHEPNKGYIPSDKVRVGGTAFEKFSFHHIPTLQEKWSIILNDYKKDVYQNTPKKYTHELESIVFDFLAYIGKADTDYTMKHFYFNFHHDGVDIFINRNI